MIVGNGMLARKFEKYAKDDTVVIFASGVSNSLESRNYEYLREHDLLLNTIKDNQNRLIVYFSTCSMYDPAAKNSQYVLHKIAMEQLIKDNAKQYLILRVSQVVGKATNETLINYLTNRIKSGQKIMVWKNSTRNLIDIDDLYQILCYLIENKLELNKTVHVANSQSISISNVINCIELTLAKVANYELLEKGARYLPIPNDIEKYLPKVNISFNDDYYARVINKYVKLS